jgi:hypothetical protein
VTCGARAEPVAPAIGESLDAAWQRRKDRARRAGRAGGGRLRHDQRDAADAATAAVAALAEWRRVLVVRQPVLVVGRPVVAIVWRAVVLHGRAAAGVRGFAGIIERGVEQLGARRARTATLADPAVGFVAGFDRTGPGVGCAVGRPGLPGRSNRAVDGIAGIGRIDGVCRVDRIGRVDWVDWDHRHVRRQRWLDCQGRHRQRGRDQ